MTLFEQAGGWSPYKDGSGLPAIRLSQAAAAAVAVVPLRLMRQQSWPKDGEQQLDAEKLLNAAERRLAVLRTTNDIEKAEVNLNRMLEIAERYGDKASDVLSDTERHFVKAQGAEIDAERLALQKQIAQIQKSATESIDEEIRRLQAVIAGKKRNTSGRR